MTLDFAKAIKSALDKSPADDQVVADIGALYDRLAASAARVGNPNAKKLEPTDGQLEALTRSAIQAHGLSALIEQAIVDEVIRAAHALVPAAPATPVKQ